MKAFDEIKKLLSVEKDDEVLPKLEKLIEEYTKQNYLLRTMGVVTMVVSPIGLVHVTNSPKLLDTLQGVQMVEKSLLELQAFLVGLKKEILEKEGKEKTNEGTVSEG